MTTDTMTDAEFRLKMDGHNETMRELIDRAVDLAWKYQCHLVTFSSAIDAYREAERFADEGPGDPLTGDQWAALDRVRKSLPEWASR